MINKKVKELMVTQINKELWSAYLYLDIARFYALKNLNGFSAWFKKQAKEEVEHAEKFFDFLNNLGEEYQLTPIEGPAKKFKTLEEPLLFQLEHEQGVTALINKIYETAKANNDHASESFLKWFVDEQLEEETTASDLIEKYKMFAKDGSGLYLLDKELGERD